MKYIENDVHVWDILPDEIIFDDKYHKYYNKNKEEYLGVSSILKTLSVQFTEKDVYKRASEATKLLWKKNGEIASNNGKLIHTAIENDWLGKPIPNEVEHFTNVIKSINKRYSSYNSVFNEIPLYNHKYKIAGTADRVMLLKTKSGNYVAEIMDFKTNSKEKNGKMVGITFFSEYEDKLFSPLDYLDDCDYTKYCLQLSFYAYMFEELTSIPVRRVFIHWVPFSKPEENKIYPAIYLKSQVQTILRNLKNEKEVVTGDFFKTATY